MLIQTGKEYDAFRDKIRLQRVIASDLNTQMRYARSQIEISTDKISKADIAKFSELIDGVSDHLETMFDMAPDFLFAGVTPRMIKDLEKITEDLLVWHQEYVALTQRLGL